MKPGNRHRTSPVHGANSSGGLRPPADKGEPFPSAWPGARDGRERWFLAIIRLEHVEKVYQPRGSAPVRALHPIDLTIEEGEIFGIVGPSGAGKSTLLRLINRLETPTRGRVWVEGQDLARLSPGELRRLRMKIGMIFQHFHLLWSRTALGNVLFPLELAGWPREKALSRARELLTRVGLSHRMDAYPARLSGGEKQRVGIARALATAPSILLSDEATSSLDPATTDDILQLIRDLHRELGFTVVLITHQMEVVEKICQRVAVLEKGSLQWVGPVEAWRKGRHPSPRDLELEASPEEVGALVEGILRRFPLKVEVERLPGHGAAWRFRFHLEGSPEARAAALRFLEGQKEVTARGL